jgi:hypothetical protein
VLVFFVFVVLLFAGVVVVLIYFPFIVFSYAIVAVVLVYYWNLKRRRERLLAFDRAETAKTAERKDTMVPCEYCGKQIPQNELVCPHCAHAKRGEHENEEEA